jgi:hypothetical protein
MNKPVVLITGGLTGIGRAAAVAFAKKGAMKPAKRSLRSYVLSARRPSTSTPTFARRMTSGIWSTRPSHGLGVSMSP